MAIRASSLAGPGVIPVGGPAGLPGQPGKDGVTQDISGLLPKTGDASDAVVTADATKPAGTLAALRAAVATRLYTFAGKFTLDSRAFVDAAQTSGGPYANYNTGAAYAEVLDQTEALAQSGGGGMRDGRFLMVRDRDTTNYEASGYRVIGNAIRNLIVGKADNFGYTTQWKDLHGTWTTAIARTGGVLRGVSGVLGEALQLGTGQATNEFAAANPPYANEQATYMVAALAHVHPQFADADSTHQYFAVQGNCCGRLSTAAFRAASVPEVGQPGAAITGLKMDDLFVRDSGITMPQSLNGDDAGTHITYVFNVYSAFNSAARQYFWIVDGVFALQASASFISASAYAVAGVLAIDASRTVLQSVAATLVAAGTTQATATALTSALSVVTSGTGGVALANKVGASQEVFNRSGAAINVYPPAGAKIEAAALNAAVSLPNGGHAVFVMATSIQAFQAP